MSKKLKLAVSIGIFIVGLLGNIYFSTIVHNFLGGVRQLSFPDFMGAIDSIKGNTQHLALLLCLQGIICCFIAMLLLSDNKPYRSSFMEVTPRIFTPVAAGQKQFGSAEWLDKRELDQSFNSYSLKESIVKQLIPGTKKKRKGGRKVGIKGKCKF